MVLEEAIEQPANTKKMVINRIGDNSIVVEKVSNTQYSCGIETPDLNPSHHLAIYSSLQEVENHFIGWSFASDIDPNGWTIYPDNAEM